MTLSSKEESSFKWDAGLYQKSSTFQYGLAMMAIDKLNPKETEKILDIGCGNGLATIEIAKRVKKGKVVAVEVSNEMYQQALSNIKEHKIDNINVVNQDAIKINYENEFDAVFSNSAIHWILDLEWMYKLIHRALKQEGRIVIQTAIKGENVLFTCLSLIQKDKRYSNFFKDHIFPWRFLTKKETEEILNHAGFKNLSVEPYNYCKAFKTKQELRDFLIAAPLVPILTILPESVHERLIGDFTELFLRMNNGSHEVKMSRLFILAEK
jgi:precorrin-6Y C5,15-methyltransferase (decarboxylating) CbiT subunit